MEKLKWTKLSNSTTPMPTIEDATKCVLSIVSGSACSHHRPMNEKLGYVAWHDWAERKTKQGHIQKQCPDCGRWYFKCEW